MNKAPKFTYWLKAIRLIIIFAFTLTSLNIPLAQAQSSTGAYKLPTAGVRVHLSPEFTPPMLKGIKVHPENPFRFDFILDKGEANLTEQEIKTESARLIKYFLATLTIPEKDLWVNLSPYEKNRIVPESFGVTEMGRDMLAQDYLLKQITASLIYPEEATGQKFWKRIYQEAAQKFGTTNVPVNTFNKVWITPDKAVVYENVKTGTAYVVESSLKVMLEQDYISMEKNTSPPFMGGARGGLNQRIPPLLNPPHKGEETNSLGSQIVREIVIPELTKEVNEGENFVKLRQVYHSLILAAWYKKKIRDSILSQVYADKNKVAGVNIDDPQEKDKIYQQYVKAFKKGVYNYIKEEHDPMTQEMIPRKYFSGGVDITRFDLAMRTVESIPSNKLPQDGMFVVDVAMSAVNLGAGQQSDSGPKLGTSQERNLGGNNTGGQMLESFVGDVWIGAGKFWYRVWIDNDIVNFRRYNQKKGTPLGSEDKLISLGVETSIGRVEGDYINSDDQLSRKHLSFKVTKDENGQGTIEVKDLQSRNGTRVEWMSPDNAGSTRPSVILEAITNALAQFKDDQVKLIIAMVQQIKLMEQKDWSVLQIKEQEAQIIGILKSTERPTLTLAIVKQYLEFRKVYEAIPKEDPVQRRTSMFYKARAELLAGLGAYTLEALQYFGGYVSTMNSLSQSETALAAFKIIQDSLIAENSSVLADSNAVTEALKTFTDNEVRLILAVLQVLDENYEEGIRTLQARETRPELTSGMIRRYLQFREVYEKLTDTAIGSDPFNKARIKLRKDSRMEALGWQVRYFRTGDDESAIMTLKSPRALAAFKTIKDALRPQTNEVLQAFSPIERTYILAVYTAIVRYKNTGDAVEVLIGEEIPVFTLAKVKRYLASRNEYLKLKEEYKKANGTDNEFSAQEALRVSKYFQAKEKVRGDPRVTKNDIEKYFLSDNTDMPYSSAALEAFKTIEDAAMTVPGQPNKKVEQEKYGGIDFNTDKMNLQVKYGGSPSTRPDGLAQDEPFRFNPAMLQKLQNAPGFEPVIINVQQMTDLKTFLGLST